MATKQEFLNFISQQVATYWAESHEPLLLSHVPALVATSLGITYQDVTEGTSLKRFLHSEALEGNVEVKVVYHPVSKARVGLIPKGASYTFARQPAATPTSTAPDAAGGIGNEQTVRDFLALVAKLPPQEAQKVVIPMEILTQLMFGK